METEALRQRVLNTGGITLDFGLFTIQAIPGFELETFYNESGITDTTKQNFKFQASIADIKTNTVIIGDQFSTTDNSYDYIFEIEGMQPDGTGWTTISASFTYKDEA